MALEGTFHDMSLVDLFEIFRLGNKSGILRVTSATQHSSIHVTMGRLIDAAVYETCTQQLVARGDDAVIQMLGWEAAEFIFTHDPSTVRHPVTIFREVDWLIRYSASLPEPTLYATEPRFEEMAISANLAFMDSPEPAQHEADRQISQNYHRLSKFTTAYKTSLPSSPATSAVRRLDLIPLDDQGRDEAPLEQASSAQPAPPARAANQSYADAPPPQAPRPAGNPAGRKLLAAVLKRVRAL